MRQTPLVDLDRAAHGMTGEGTGVIDLILAEDAAVVLQDVAGRLHLGKGPALVRVGPAEVDPDVHEAEPFSSALRRPNGREFDSEPLTMKGHSQGRCRGAAHFPTPSGSRV
jgi:hypothetical protein